jgi:hypothetical protein
VTDAAGDAWHTMLNGAVSYRTVAPGTVLLHVENVTLTGGVIRGVGQLPIAYRPSSDRSGAVSDGNGSGIVIVRGNGNVELYAGASGDYSGFVAY